MKHVLFFAVILISAVWPFSLQAQSTIPILNSSLPKTQVTTGPEGTPTSIPRVTVNDSDDDLQPPADGPMGDDMGPIAVPRTGNPAVNGTSTPVSLETMRSTVAALIPDITSAPTDAASRATPMSVPNPLLPTPTIVTGK